MTNWINCNIDKIRDWGDSIQDPRSVWVMMQPLHACLVGRMWFRMRKRHCIEESRKLRCRALDIHLVNIQNFKNPLLRRTAVSVIFKQKVWVCWWFNIDSVKLFVESSIWQLAEPGFPDLHHVCGICELFDVFGRDQTYVRHPLLPSFSPGLSRRTSFWGIARFGWLNRSNTFGLGLGFGCRIRSLMWGFLVLIRTFFGLTVFWSIEHARWGSFFTERHISLEVIVC